jgi:hypothetical protein
MGLNSPQPLHAMDFDNLHHVQVFQPSAAAAAAAAAEAQSTINNKSTHSSSAILASIDRDLLQFDSALFT